MVNLNLVLQIQERDKGSRILYNSPSTDREVLVTESIDMIYERVRRVEGKPIQKDKSL